jgi:hypothetical protein
MPVVDLYYRTDQFIGLACGGALQAAITAGGDAFLAKLNLLCPAAAASFIPLTLVEWGRKTGLGNCIFVTTNGDYYFVGTTTSTNGFRQPMRFPLCGGGCSDAFVAAGHQRIFALPCKLLNRSGGKLHLRSGEQYSRSISR